MRAPEVGFQKAVKAGGTRTLGPLPLLRPVAHLSPTSPQVLLVLLLLSYHVWALHLSSVSATLSTAHLVVFALMLAVDLLVLAAMLTMYLRAQCTQRYTNRKGNSGPQKV